MLGAGHPLVSVIRLRSVLGRQSLVTSLVLLLGIAGVFFDAPRARELVGAACAVQLVLAGLIGFLRQLQRERCWDLIIEGSDGLLLRSVVRERRRLLSVKGRRQLACSLERALDAAQHWHEIAVACRPPAGIRCLNALVAEAERVLDDLSPAGAGVRGIALTARLLAGGYASPLYQGRTEELRQELHRIHFLLGPPSSG